MAMMLVVRCLACQGYSQVAERHVGGLVHCPRCGQPFVAVAAAAPTEPRQAVGAGPSRLDVGQASASSPGQPGDDGVLTQHLTWVLEGQRRELVVLMAACGVGEGEVSRLAGATLVRNLYQGLAPLLGGMVSGQFADAGVNVLSDAADFALQEANRTLFRKARGGPGTAGAGMGGAATLVLVRGPQAAVGHVGNTRLYHLRDGRAAQVTRDHTLAARMVELGQLSAKEAARHPGQHTLTQSVGQHNALSIDRHALTLQPGEGLVLCTAALAQVVPPGAVEQALLAARPAAEAAHDLVEQARRAGGRERCAVVILRQL